MPTLTTSWQTVASYRFAPGTGIIVDFYLDAKYSSQSQTNNTTTIQTRLNCVLTQGYGSGTSYNFTLSYGGTVSGGGSWTFATETITTGNATITHNNDGTKNLTLSASMRVGYTGLDASMSANVTLPKINRYPQISNATNFTDEENPSMTFSNQGLYPVRVKIEAGGNTQLITRDISQTATSYTFELTNEERNTLRQLAQNSNTLTTRFTVCAMNGNTELSSSSIDKTMTVVNANPTMTYTIQETNQNAITVLGGSDTNYLIQNVSVPNVVVTPTTLKYATVSRVGLTNGTYTNSKTTSPYSFSFTAIDGTIGLKVVDSRNNSVEDTITKTLIEYQPVAINSFNFERQNPTSSNIVLNADIKYYQKTFNETANVPTLEWMVISSNSGLFPSNNLFPGDDVYIGATWNEIDPSDYTINTQNNKITISNLILNNVIDYREKAELYIRVKDLLTEANNHMTIIKGIPTIDMGEHDLQVNGDLYVADENRENRVNILETLQSLIPVTIYENSSGNIGNITLDDSIENYRKIKIYGIASGDGALHVSQEFLTDNQNNIEIQINWNVNGNGIVYPSGTHYTINGTAMTMDYHYRIGLYGSNQGYDSSTNNFAVVKIEGYI